ncbi:hypothetical protein [Corynebacterium pseudokroppenstedtii]|uniref:hypothetical protein n=1 Tax=Corynebacterium pseudokroppenstedtii TaxID=2804917 RepID=UPI003078B7AC
MSTRRCSTRTPSKKHTGHGSSARELEKVSRSQLCEADVVCAHERVKDDRDQR